MIGVISWTPETDLDVPGVYQGVPEILYHKLPHCSASRLKRLVQRSPYAVRWDIDHPQRDAVPASSLRLGTAMHVALLEPEDFDDRVIAYPDFRGKRAAEALAEIRAGKVAVTSSEWNKASALRLGAGMPESARNALRLLDHAELTIIHEIDGVLCKSRIDGVCSKGGFILDVKTGQVSPEDLARKLYTLGYDMQFALYADAVEAWTGQPQDVLLLAVTQEAPIEGAIYNIASAVMVTGRERYLAALARWKQCEASGVWPYAQTADIQELTYPKWAEAAIEEELAR